MTMFAIIWTIYITAPSQAPTILDKSLALLRFDNLAACEVAKGLIMNRQNFAACEAHIIAAKRVGSSVGRNDRDSVHHCHQQASRAGSKGLLRGSARRHDRTMVGARSVRFDL